MNEHYTIHRLECRSDFNKPGTTVIGTFDRPAVRRAAPHLLDTRSVPRDLYVGRTTAEKFKAETPVA